MPNTYSTEAQLLQNQPKQYPNASYAGGRMRRFRNTITLASQGDGDTITCQPVPAGHVFAFGVLTTSVTLGSSTLAIGVAGTAAKFRTAATFTAVDVPTLFGKNGPASADFLTSVETPIITIGAAALPSSGTLVVDFYYSGQ